MVPIILVKNFLGPIFDPIVWYIAMTDLNFPIKNTSTCSYIFHYYSIGLSWCTKYTYALLHKTYVDCYIWWRNHEGFKNLPFAVVHALGVVPYIVDLPLKFLSGECVNVQSIWVSTLRRGRLLERGSWTLTTRRSVEICSSWNQ